MNQYPLAHVLCALTLLAFAPTAWADPQSLCPTEPKGTTMTRQITTQIDIDAPADVVWDILLDFDRYPDWNPFVKEISGDATPGARLAIKIQPPEGSSMSFKPTVLVAREREELRWLGRVGLPRIFDGEHSFVIQPIDEARIRLIHSECFRGILVPLLWNGLETNTRAGFEQMNGALKERAEKKGSLARAN